MGASIAMRIAASLSDCGKGSARGTCLVDLVPEKNTALHYRTRKTFSFYQHLPNLSYNDYGNVYTITGVF